MVTANFRMIAHVEKGCELYLALPKNVLPAEAEAISHSTFQSMKQAIGV